MAAKKPKTESKPKTKRWSQHVTETSFALDLDRGIFTWDDPHRIAESLKESAERSKARKTTPFRSAMSMLNFYINRAGKISPRNSWRLSKQPRMSCVHYMGGIENRENKQNHLSSIFYLRHYAGRSREALQCFLF
jgi:hypothetical protein